MSDLLSRLPDAELELIMIIWEANKPVNSAYIMEKINGKKKWGITTVLNLLRRLMDRGFLTRERTGRFDYYTAIVDEKSYIIQESKVFLEKLHGSSLLNLVKYLYDGKAISREDLKELQQFVDEITLV